MDVMRDFNGGNKFGGSRGRSNFGGRDSGKPRFSSRDSGRGNHTMHEAVCAECGNICNVPFVPISGKPVYCSDCFEKRAGGESDSRSPRRGNFDRPSKPSFSERRPFSAPTAPAFNNRNQENDDKKFDQLNAKLDKILKTLNYMINKDVKPDEVAVAEIASIIEEVKTEKAPAKVKTKKAKAKKIAE
jgi:CxxC-x17-CxxC domain-containing protein